MSIGIRRRGTFVDWKVTLPSDLLFRVDTFYYDRLARKPLYGFRSQLFCKLLQDWVNATDRPVYGAGTRRAGTMVPFKLAVPIELSDAVIQLCAGPDGAPIYGFRSQLLTLLLTRWCDEKEAALLRSDAVASDSASLLT